MANTAAPRGSRFSGWFYDAVTPAMKFYNRGTLAQTVSGNDLTLPDALTVAGSAVSIRGIAYTFPAADGANTTQLTTNGSGVLAWLPADDGAA